jgi:hypothetical protein
MLLDCAGTRVIGGQGERPGPEGIELHPQIPCATFKVLFRIHGIDAKKLCCTRHELREPQSPLGGDRSSIPAALLVDKSQEEIFRNTVPPCSITCDS